MTTLKRSGWLLLVLALTGCFATFGKRGTHEFWHDECLEAFEKNDVAKWYAGYGDCFESIAVYRCIDAADSSEAHPTQRCQDEVAKIKSDAAKEQP